MHDDFKKFQTETTQRYYDRLVSMYNRRMEKAVDKDYTHNEFEKYCSGILTFRYECGEKEQLVSEFDHGYKTGKEYKLIIKQLRKRLTYRYTDDIISDDIISGDFEFIGIVEDDKTINGEPVSKKDSKPYPTFKDYSDQELVRVYAEYRAYKQFNEYLKTVKPLTDTLQGEIEDQEKQENKDKLKEFTTTRQVMSFYYLFRYCQVKNVDNTEKARFIQFLTGKNYDNIYKRLQNPLNGSARRVKEDLKYVHAYFERLGLLEIVKLISQELDSGKY